MMPLIVRPVRHLQRLVPLPRSIASAKRRARYRRCCPSTSRATLGPAPTHFRGPSARCTTTRAPTSSSSLRGPRTAPRRRCAAITLSRSLCVHWPETAQCMPATPHFNLKALQHRMMGSADRAYPFVVHARALTHTCCQVPTCQSKSLVVAGAARGDCQDHFLRPAGASDSTQGDRHPGAGAPLAPGLIEPCRRAAFSATGPCSRPNALHGLTKQ